MTATFPPGQRLFRMLAAMAVVYAFLAGLHTLAEPDLFWLLASGRWIAQHHQIFSTDVFSYTAPGQPWIYPVGPGLVFYAAYLLGGYALISWLGAAACAATVALLLRRGSAVSAAIAVIAVPLIAARTGPRAEMFTVVLFAAYLSILWQNYQTGRARLWLLPLLMIAWVNLHLGFLAGLAAVVAFACLEVLEMLFPGTRRREAMQRLRRASPWFVATAVATLLNPWGWGIYRAILRQDRVMALHSGRIVEWSRVPMNWAAVTSASWLRDTRGALYVLLVIVAIAASLALLRRQPGAAILLVGAIYQALRHLRMEALAACIVVVVGGSVLFAAMQQIRWPLPNARTRSALALAVVAMFALLVYVRASDLVKDRHRDDRLTAFGPGVSWWFPERAVEFIRREDLPGEVFNTYNEGSYVLWRLGPKRRDYIDGRAIPFGEKIFQHQSDLLHSSLDAEAWQREAERYNINTIILPLDRMENALGELKTSCNSTAWRPVYLDEVSVVLVRLKPETEDLIQRLRVDCATASLSARPLVRSSDAAFHQGINAASVLSALGRNSEALAATDKARLIVPHSPLGPWMRGNIFSAMGSHSEAEQQYRVAISAEPGEALFWFSLATLYKKDGRLAESIHAERRAIDVSPMPEPRELIKLARLYLEAQHPKAALQTFEEAVNSAPPDVLAVTGGRSFKFDVAQGRATAWRALGDPKRAAAYDEEAVEALVPQP